MDNHPIPQDVTNFQFRLIGDMTLKQFGYVVSGVILGWVTLASPLFILLKLLVASVFVLAGVVLAFVPIEGRPSDLMVLHFIKALLSPTQFLYQKTPPPAQPSTLPMKSTTPPPPLQKEAKEPKEAAQKVMLESFTPTATAAVQTSLQNQKTEEEAKHVLPPSNLPVAPNGAVKQAAVLQQEVAQLTQALTTAQKEESLQSKGTSGELVAHEKVTDLEKELQEITQQKQELERQLVALQKTLTEKKQAVFTPSTAQPVINETQNVKKIPKQMSTGIGAPLVPDVPNLITGIIKDPRGNVLANMLIEVKDKDGNPVRAFKTNQLGQFASATPLLNGTYTVTFEDPAGKQSFDSVEITATGDILMPLEITSVDAREKLRQELFSNTNAIT